MATFANQSSNLSALNSALTSFSEILVVSDDAASRLTKGTKKVPSLDTLHFTFSPFPSLMSSLLSVQRKTKRMPRISSKLKGFESIGLMNLY